MVAEPNIDYSTGVPIVAKKLDSRLRQARAEKYPDCSASEVARKHGWVTDEGHVSTYLSHEGGSRIPDEDAKKYGKALGVNPAWLKYMSDEKYLIEDKGLPSRIVADGEKVDIDQLGPHQARTLAAAMAGMKAEAWRITSDMMIGADPSYLPGDIVIVDLAARPKPQDIVLAEVSRIPIFRMYTRINLWSFHMSGRNPPIPVDSPKITIKGVVVPGFRF